MKQLCLLLLSLFLATLTGAWAQTISGYSITGNGCLGPGSTNPRTIGVSFSSDVAGAGATAYRVAIFNSTNVFQNSTTIPGLVAGANGPVNVNVSGTGTGFYARVQSSTDGITWTNLNAPSSGFDIQITPSINGYYIPAGASWFACEGSTITEYLTFNSPLDFGPYTVTYTINGTPNRGPFTAPGTLSAGNTALSFVSQPLIDTDNGNFTIVSITGTGAPCAIGGLGSFNFVNVSQYPTISAAATAGPVCEATGSVFNLNGLISLNTGGAPSPYPVTVAVQRIKYKIDGGAEQTATVTVTSPTGTVTIPTTGLADGNHTLTITAIEKVNADNTVCTRILMAPINASFEVRKRPVLTIGALTSGPLCELETSNTWAATLTLSAFGMASPATSPYTILGAPAAVGISQVAGPTTAGAGTLTVTHTSTPGTKSATFTITDNNGCVSDGIAHSFVINANPTATLTPTQPTICAADQGAQSVTLTYGASGGTGPYTYTWGGTAGISATGTGASDSQPSPNATTGTVFVTIVDANGCQDVSPTRTIRRLTVTSAASILPSPAAGCSIFTPGAIDGSTPSAAVAPNAAPAPTGPVYTWERTGANNTTWADMMVNAEDYPSTALPANTSAIDEVYQFRRTTAYSRGGTTCSLTNDAVSLTVWPNPNIADVGPGTGAPFVICSGSAVAPYTPGQTPGDVVPAGTLYTWALPVNAAITSGLADQMVGVAQFSTPNLVSNSTIAQDVVYTVTATTTNGCTDVFTITVRVNPKPVITTVGAVPPTICASQTTTLTFNLQGIPGVNHSITYSQTAGMPLTAVTNPVSPLSPVEPGDFSFTSTPPSGNPMVQTTMTYTIGSVTYNANGITCAYTLNAPSLSYTLEPEPPIPFGAGGAGSNIVIKDPITNKSEVCEGTGTVAITNDATCGAGFTTKWYVDNTTPFAAGSGLASAPATINTTTSAAMHPSQPAVLSPGTITWYVACRNEVTGCETPPAKRKAVSFTVNPAPARPASAAAIGLNPNQICEGAPTPSVAMTNTADAACVAVNAAGFTAVWYDNMGVMLPPSGAAPTMTPTVTTTWQVRCKNPVTGCISLSARNVTFTVNPAPVPPFVIPLAADPTPTFYPSQACQGPTGSTVPLNPVDIIAIPNTVPFNITCGVGRTMKWYLNDGVTLFNGGVSPAFLPTDVPGVHTYKVSCIQNSTGCESLTKTSISFTVNPAPLAPATITLSPMTACASSPAAPMSNNATCTGSSGPESPVWYDNMGVALVGGAPVTTPTTVGPTTYQVRCKNTTTNCLSLTFTTVTFTVFPTPTIDPIVPATATYCNGAPVFPLPLSGTPAVAMAPNSAVWFKYSGGASIGLADGTTSTGLPGFNAINNGTVVVNVPITITPYTFGPNGMNDGGTGDDCLGVAATYTITVIPTPTVTFTCPAPVCANDAFSAIAFTSPVAGTVFNWTNDNTTIGLAGAGMGNIASFTGLNASTTMSNIGVLSVTPSVTVNSVTCTGPVVTCNLVVKPRPSSNLTASQTDVCPNTEVTLNPNCSIPTPTSVVQWGNGAGSALPAPAGPTVTPTAPDLTYIYTAICVADGCAGNMSEATIRTHRLLVDIVKVAHPGGNVNQPGAIMEVQNDLGKDLSVPKNTIVSNDGMTPRTWNIVARPCYAPVGSISFEFLAGPLPLSYKTVDNFAPHAFFANDGANTFYSQASMTYGPGSMMPFYTGGTPNFPNGIYTVLVQGRTNAVPGAIPAARNKLSGGALLSTRTVTFEVKGTNSGARIGVEEEVVDAENWLSLVQNPISEEIMIRISGNVGDNVQLNLSNLQGQEVHKSNLQLETTSQLNKINARDFNTGFYILKAVNGDKVKTIKVLKVQ